MGMRCIIWIIVAVIVQIALSQRAQHWNDEAKIALNEALRLEMDWGVAKNVILFLGDGMDITTQTAARIFKGQRKGETGEEGYLRWHKFPYVALSKTYNTDRQVPDSAGTGTAYLTGVKTKFGTIGFDDGIVRYDCATEQVGVPQESIGVRADKEGKATGFISTTRVTHASPANLYAHVADRNWESDDDLTEEAVNLGCTDIASQFIENAGFFKVVLAGGRREMTPVGQADPEYPEKEGQRLDNRDLIQEWVDSKENMNAQYVWNLDDFNGVNPDDTDYLLGLFEPSHMNYERDRELDAAGEPSIAEMTEKAIQILSKDEDGYFLFVEGGRIDHGHHAGVAYNALLDTLAFEEAVEKALDMVDLKETLVIVTADHGHVMTMAGYPSRGNPILGKNDIYMGDDGLPFSTLAYMNGPGAPQVHEAFNKTGKRPDLTNVDTEDPHYLQDALVPLVELEETHGGQDVGIFAIGPMAHLFHGVHEQTYVNHVMRYASCLDYKEHCENPVGGASALGAVL
ncbi:hypothetical protein BSL78_04762, partial [Apostichopus japonicus]